MIPPLLKVMVFMAMAFALTASQGCLRISSIGEGREDKEKHLKTAQAKGPLNEGPRIDAQGDVTIEIRFAGITYKEDLAFNVEIHTRWVKLGQYPLDKMSTLSNDKGTQVPASKWEISLLTENQVFGTLYFPAKDSSGNLLLAPGVTNITLAMEMPRGAPKIGELGGAPKRIFQWNVPPGSEGKKTIEKISWADNDGELHLSFPALWRAIKSNLRQIQYSRE